MCWRNLGYKLPTVTVPGPRLVGVAREGLLYSLDLRWCASPFLCQKRLPVLPDITLTIWRLTLISILGEQIPPRFPFTYALQLVYHVDTTTTTSPCPFFTFMHTLMKTVTSRQNLNFKQTLGSQPNIPHNHAKVCSVKISLDPRTAA